MGPCVSESFNLVVGVPSFNALGTMLVSVVGVGVHWLNVTVRSLYVQWVKFFKICFFGVLYSYLHCTYPLDFIHPPHHLITCAS